MSKPVSRRQFLKLSTASVAGVLLASCAPAATATPEVIERVVTSVVEIQGTPVVQTAIVKEVITATPAPTKAPEVVQILGFPRAETVFAQQLTGRNATPTNFNMWAGWRQRDRGMQQVMNEPLWTDDFEAGEIINSLAEEPPGISDDFKTMTIKLRQGMMWSDGTEITADDL